MEQNLGNHPTEIYSTEAIETGFSRTRVVEMYPDMVYDIVSRFFAYRDFGKVLREINESVSRSNQISGVTPHDQI